jgi:radical SAM superfamily enzyme YgiQ (UPF0313 family)
MKILLVYPTTPETFWSFKHVLRFVSKRASFPPLGLLTSLRFLPADWQVKLVDLNVNRLTDDDLRWADYVMLSAMIVHKASVSEIVNRCRRLGTPIIAGGPLFTTGHAAFPDIDHFVLGEAEEIMPQVIEDMRRGTVRHTYAASSRPDITRVPSPRWDLIDLRSYVTMSVQFSRGCPFDCEFCDIIVMNGRVPRTKSPAQLVAELEELRLRGWKAWFSSSMTTSSATSGRPKRCCENHPVANADRRQDGIPDRGVGQPGRRRRTLRPHGARRLQEGLRRVRDALAREPEGMPKTAELQPRPRGDGEDAAAGRPGGHGRVHRGI